MEVKIRYENDPNYSETVNTVFNILGLILYMVVIMILFIYLMP